MTTGKRKCTYIANIDLASKFPTQYLLASIEQKLCLREGAAWTDVTMTLGATGNDSSN